MYASIPTIENMDANYINKMKQKFKNNTKSKPSVSNSVDNLVKVNNNDNVIKDTT